jgi:Lrp/AsnC family transcriptional regulator for asnA, asnC and gidA
MGIVLAILSRCAALEVFGHQARRFMQGRVGEFIRRWNADGFAAITEETGSRQFGLASLCCSREGSRMMSQNLDSLDRWLVRYLQDHPRATYVTIARETDVSESTIKRRVEALIERGVVTPAMLPDIYQLGYETSAFVGLSVDLNHLDVIADELARLPETAMVAESSIQSLRQLVSGKIAAIPGVRETETFVTPALHKLFRDWRLTISDGAPVRPPEVRANQPDLG